MESRTRPMHEYRVRRPSHEATSDATTSDETIRVPPNKTIWIVLSVMQSMPYFSP
jgi:hypothetical protein